MDEKKLKLIEDKKMLVDMLVNPPEPNNKLKEAHERYLNHLRYKGNSNNKTE